MKKALSAILSIAFFITLLSTTAIASDATSFIDYNGITPKYRAAVEYVCQKDIITGYQGNQLLPKNNFSRGQAAKILSVMILGVEKANELSNTQTSFSDVSEKYPLAPYIAYCTSLGYINGYPDGSFRPTNVLTAGAFAKMLLNFMQYQPDTARYTGNDWSENVYQDALSSGLFTTDMDFGMLSSLTREQAAWLAYNAIQYELKQSPPDQAKESETSQGSEAKSIKTAAELEAYLNGNMSSCQTPMGTYTYKFSVEENTYDMYGYDYRINAEHKYGAGPWFDIEHSLAVSDADKAETLKLLREFQKSIYEIASGAFPNSKIRGGFYDWWYKYPYSKVGYNSTQVLSWKNYENRDKYSSGIIENYDSTYITEFHWDSSLDDYKFAE